MSLFMQEDFFGYNNLQTCENLLKTIDASYLFFLNKNVARVKDGFINLSNNLLILLLSPLVLFYLLSPTYAYLS